MVVVSKKAINFFEFVLRGKIAAIAIFPFIIVHPRTKVNDVLLNHERIHLRQQLELLVIPFYVWYLIESAFKDYRQISFEKESFANERDMNYLQKRKLFGFRKYLKQTTYTKF